MGFKLTVPKRIVQNEYQAFPKGTYACEFNRVEDNSRGTQGDDDWKFSLRTFFRNLTPMDEETPDVGSRPFRGEINIVWDGVSLLDLESADQIDSLPFQLTRGIATLSQLAVAVGAAEADAKGNVSFSIPEFVAALRGTEEEEGAYNETPVILTVGHYTTRAAPDTPRDQIDAILAAETAEVTADGEGEQVAL